MVVVEDGDVQHLFESALYLKAARSGDVLEVDAAVGRRDVLHGGDDLVGVLRRKTHGHGVHSREFAEQHTLALHDGHARKGAYVAQPQHGAAVGDDGDGVPFAGERIGKRGILRDLKTGRGDARGVSERERLAGVRPDAGVHLEFALPLVMLRKRFFHVIHIHKTNIIPRINQACERNCPRAGALPLHPGGDVIPAP